MRAVAETLEAAMHALGTERAAFPLNPRLLTRADLVDDAVFQDGRLGPGGVRRANEPVKDLRGAALGARQLLAYLSYSDKAIERDLHDLVAFMRATGLRIGEVAALTWDCVDLDAGVIDVRGTVLRLSGQGPVIKPSQGSDGERRVRPPLSREGTRRRSPSRAPTLTAPSEFRLVCTHHPENSVTRA